MTLRICTLIVTLTISKESLVIWTRTVQETAKVLTGSVQRLAYFSIGNKNISYKNPIRPNAITHLFSRRSQEDDSQTPADACFHI